MFIIYSICILLNQQYISSFNSNDKIYKSSNTQNSVKLITVILIIFYDKIFLFFIENREPGILESLDSIGVHSDIIYICIFLLFTYNSAIETKKEAKFMEIRMT